MGVNVQTSSPTYGLGRCAIGRSCRPERALAGQATIELMVALPVLIAIAVIAVNALLFVSECASFDRLARDAVRTYAASPAYGTGATAATSDVQGALEQSFNREYLHVDVRVGGHSPALMRYTATLVFTPTLFGHPFSGSVFGVQMPPLSHDVSLTIDPYKPGAFV